MPRVCTCVRVCLMERLWHSCCHKQCWVSVEWVYLFSKSYKSLDIFSMLAGSSQCSELVAVSVQEKNQTYSTSILKLAWSLFRSSIVVEKNAWMHLQASSRSFMLTCGTKPCWNSDESSRLKSRGKKRHKYVVEWDKPVQPEGQFDLKSLNRHYSSPIYTAGPKLHVFPRMKGSSSDLTFSWCSEGI